MTLLFWKQVSNFSLGWPHLMIQHSSEQLLCSWGQG